MGWPRNVKIVPAYCKHGKDKLFGIRTEYINNAWIMNWAFKMRQDQALRDGYTDTSIKGKIFFDSEYPGCPYCGNAGWYQCGNCKNLICSDSSDSFVTCPVCGNQGSLINSNEFSDIKSGAM